MRSLCRVGTLALLSVAVVTCSEAPTVTKLSSDAIPPSVRLAAALPRPAALASAVLDSSGLTLDHLRVTIVRPPNDTLKDTTLTYSSADTAVVVELTLDATVGEQLGAGLQYLAGNTVLFAGSTTVTARAVGSQTGPSSAPFALKYVGPGATAKRLVVTPSSGNFTAPGTVAFEAVGIDSSGVSIGPAPVTWSVSDASVGTITAGGVFSPTGKRGTEIVTATTLGGLSGHASVDFVPPAAKVVLIGGDAQTGQVAHALAQPLTVEVQAADGSPVPGRPVVFFANAGSISPLTAVTDSAGRAHAVMTLGPTAGKATYAAVSGSYPVTVTETATVGPATGLGFVQQPSSTASAKPLSPAIIVQVEDSCGNLVSTASPSVTLALDAASMATGAVLGGTLTATAVNGVATFSNVTVDRSGSSFRIVASAPGLASGTSSAFDIQPGPLQLLAVGSTTFTMTAGQSPTNAPYAHVVDKNGADVRAVSMHIAVHKGTTLLAEFNASTDAAGKFTASDAVVTAAGTYTVDISNTSLVGSPRRFTVTVQPADPASYLLSVSNARPTSGSNVNVTASLVDKYGNAIATSGKAITWSSTNGGSFSSATSSTGPDGTATAVFTASTTAGVTHVLAATDGVLKGSYYDLTTVAP